MENIELVMYTDGSFNKEAKLFGGAYLLIDTDTNTQYCGMIASENPQYLPHQNVAGECFAVIEGLKRITQLGLIELPTIVHIYYDYSGLQEWIKGSWEIHSPISIYYKEQVDYLCTKYQLLLDFHKVKAHTGVKENEYVDQLAKVAVGLSKIVKDKGEKK